MPLSWNEIRDRATAFATDWAHTHSEDADAKPFWDAFFHIFGVSRRKVASFEQRVHKLGDAQGKIDLLWKGTLLIEHKSRGKNLERAYQQAMDYFPGLKPEELPRYVLVCDFHRFELHDLEPDNADAGHTIYRFTLDELPEKIHLFAFIAGYRTQRIRESDPINEKAVLAIGVLHDELQRDHYTGEKLEVFLVRLLFCLFADDTGIFQPKDSFHDLIEFHTSEDGSNVGMVLREVFEILNEKPENRQSKLAEHFSVFPYVNGKLFEAYHRPPQFNAAMRKQLLALCDMNWGAISPAIFGSMFQTVIALDSNNRRRQLGAHYTSETNILKLLGPLCFDELRAEFAGIQKNKNALFEFHKKLRTLTFLDPACGCGNFLVIAYRELRRLEMDVLHAASQLGQSVGDIFAYLQVDVDQFFGIEIEEFPAQIAQVAMWLTDHQMNLAAGALFGRMMTRIPLAKSATIRKGDALKIDWAELVPPERLHFILGNPPFIGSKLLSAEQKISLESVTQDLKGAGVLDFVAGWFIKAGQYISSTPDGFGGIVAKATKGRKNFADMQFGQIGQTGKTPISTGFDSLFADAQTAEIQQRRAVRCGFVSTNSITQGEQVGILWAWMLAQGIHIRFAHRTFKWTNEAPGKAAVHCVIVGFGMTPAQPPRLFVYDDIQGNPHEITVSNINPYLVDAPLILLPNRNKPICNVPEMGIGNKPIDDGNYLFTTEERDVFIAKEPQSQPYFKRWLGAQEFLNGSERWCLWLGDCAVSDLQKMPEVRKRIDAVRKFRLSSKSTPTQKLASKPTRFHVENMPKTAALLIPRVSSEKRSFIPIGMIKQDEFTSDTSLLIPNATLYEFAILTSTMHNAWIRYTCGRLKSDYRYSAGVVYNNFPWPELAEKQASRAKSAIEKAAQAVLDARAVHQQGENPASLAILYNPTTMPANLTDAHRALDKAVDAAYGFKGKKTDEDRVAFLFSLYAQLTSLV